MPEPLEKVKFGGNEVESLMVKTRKLSDIQQEFAFTEFNLYQRKSEVFYISELGHIKSFRPFREMAIPFVLIEEKSKSLRTKRSRKSFFTASGLTERYTSSRTPMQPYLPLMEAMNGNIHYRIFCGIRICPENQLTSYKLIDNILQSLIFHSQSFRILIPFVTEGFLFYHFPTFSLHNIH